MKIILKNGESFSASTNTAAAGASVAIGSDAKVVGGSTNSIAMGTGAVAQADTCVQISSGRNITLKSLQFRDCTIAKQFTIGTEKKTKIPRTSFEPSAQTALEYAEFSKWYPDGSVTSESQFTSGLRYSLDGNGNALIKSFCNTGTAADDNSDKVGAVVIPPYIVDSNGVKHTVIGISDSAGNNIKNTNLTSVIMPSTVTNIGSYAFYNCSGLTSITIPNSVTSIGVNAFYGCSALTSIMIPDSVTSIGIYAFRNCTGLTSITIPDSVTSIEERAFYGCSGLTSITIPNSVTSINQRAFRYCSGLTFIDFGDTAFSSIPTLGSNDVFEGVPTTCKFIVPDSQHDTWKATSGWSDLVTSGYTFLRHSEWEYVHRYELDPILFDQYYPEGNVKSAAEFTSGIKYDAPDTTNRTITVKPFCNTGTATNDNSNLSGRVVIPPFVDVSHNGYISDDGTRYKVVGVSDGSLAYDNTNLTAIVAPNTVTTIGGCAFADCTSLTSISLPSAQTVGDGAFGICSSLTSVYLPVAVTISKEAFYSCTSLTSISLPSAQTVGESAFSYCTSLTSISLPSAQTVGESAFSYCDSLASISLPAATTIGEGSFNSCTALTIVSLPAATSIGDRAFGGCAALASVSLPSAQTVGESAFSYCTLLDSADFGDTPRSDVPSLGSNAFSSVPTSCKIIVPDAQYDAWIAASGWSSLVTQGYKFLKHSEWEYVRKFELTPSGIGAVADHDGVVDGLTITGQGYTGRYLKIGNTLGFDDDGVYNGSDDRITFDFVPEADTSFVVRHDIAPEYDDTSLHSYDVGQLVLHKDDYMYNRIYRCTSAHTSDDWVSANWTRATVEDVLAVIRSEKADSAAIAPAFSASSTYAVGDYVTHDGLLYKCSTAITTAAAWDSTKWTAVAVMSEATGGAPKNVWYGTCTTLGTSSIKVATTTSGNFVAAKGNVVIVKFSYASSTGMKLNVDGTGVYNIKAAGSNIGEGYWTSNEVRTFVFDGSAYVLADYAKASTSTLGVVQLSDTVSSNKSYAATPSAVNTRAPKESPEFTGTPKAPTAAAGTNTKQIATTAFVQTAVGSKADDSSLAPAFSDSLTYAVGDYCTHEGLLYKCSTAVTTAGAWNAADWTAVAVTDEMAPVIPPVITVDGIRLHGRDGRDYLLYVDSYGHLTLEPEGQPQWTQNEDGGVSTYGELNEDGTLTVDGELNEDGTLTVQAGSGPEPDPGTHGEMNNDGSVTIQGSVENDGTLSVTGDFNEDGTFTVKCL